MARSASDYTNSIINDPCDGTVSWSNGNGCSHNNSGGIKTIVDNSTSSEYIYINTGNSDADWYWEIKMRYTAVATNSPLLFQVRDTANWGGKAIAGLQLIYTDGSIKAINGGDITFTDTGVDLAVDTWTTIKMYGNTTSQEYYVDIDGTEYGPYDSQTGASGVIEELVIGGGGSTSQWTYEVDYVYFKDTYSPVGTTGQFMTTNTRIW